VVGVGTTSLTNVVAILPATGSVRLLGGQYSMHVVIKDDSASAYDVRALALVLSDATTLLFVYSQSGLIATKSVSASLHMAIDLTVDASTGAVITFGTTDYALPMASESAPGIAELATVAEVTLGTDTSRVVSARGVRYSTDESLSMQAAVMLVAANRATSTPDASFAGSFVSAADLGGTYVISGSSGGTPELQTSPDGVTWTRRTVAAGANPIRGAFRVGSLWLVGHGGTTGVHSSADGVTWTARTTTGYCNALSWSTTSGNAFCVVGPAGFIATSLDGITWTTRTPASSYAGEFKDIVDADTAFVAVGSAGEIQRSADGITWTRVKTSGAQISAVAHVGGSTPSTLAFADDGVVWASYDRGLTWAAVQTIAGVSSVTKALYVDGLFLVCTNAFVKCVSLRGNRSRTLTNGFASMSGTPFLSCARSALLHGLIFVGPFGRIEKSTLDI
jgi:hypothetical protein